MDACKKCGKERRTDKIRAKRCYSCEWERRKRSEAKRRGGSFRSKGSYININNTYIVSKCSVCAVEYNPNNSRHIRCDRCSKLCVDIIQRLTRPRETWRGKERKRMTLSKDDLLILAKKYIYTHCCVYCCSEFTEDNIKTFDHKVPLCMGGENISSNIEICCFPCNKAKGMMPLAMWIELCKRVAANPLF